MNWKGLQLSCALSKVTVKGISETKELKREILPYFIYD